HVGQLLVPRKGEDPGVLQETSEDGPYPDVLAQPRDTGPDPADATHHDVHRHPGLAGPVQRVDGRLVDDRVGLDLDPGVPAGAAAGDLALDVLDESAADRARRDEQPPE